MPPTPPIDSSFSPPPIDGFSFSTSASPSTSSSSTPLRLLTINVCVFPRSARNKYAVAQMQVALLSTLFFLYYFLSFLSCPSSPLRLPLCLRILLLPIFYLSVFFPTFHLQAALMNLLYRFQWHDYKKERIDLLLSYLQSPDPANNNALIPTYDCICVQELFSCWFVSKYRQHFLSRLRSMGYLYVHSFTTLPIFPCFVLDAGVLIISRFPIVQKHEIVFQNQALFDRIVVPRGALHAQIAVPIKRDKTTTATSNEIQLVDIFTCHIAPPIKEVQLRVPVLKYVPCAQLPQIIELMHFISICNQPPRKGARHNPLFIAGDINIDGGSEEYFEVMKEGKRVLGNHFVDYFSQTNAEKKMVNRYSDVIDMKKFDSQRRSRNVTRSSSCYSPSAAVAPAPPSPLGPSSSSLFSSSPSSSSPSYWRWEATFGRADPIDGSYEETFLTHETLLGSKTCHDHIFGTLSKAECRPVGRVERFDVRDKQEKKSLAYQQVSDHCGVALTVELPRNDRRMN